MKSAILGGSFNPVHNGHLKLARHVLDRTGYEQVVLIPAGTPPHKELSGGAEDADRLEMLRLATAGMTEIAVWDGELRRPGRSYTIDTVRQLRREGIVDGRPGLIIGDDLLEGFHLWKKVDSLIAETDIILANRGGDIPDHLPFSPLLLNNELWPYSSTDVRGRIAGNGDTSEMLPAAVADYIRENGLYGLTG